jgi:hypothetical protein
MSLPANDLEALFRIQEGRLDNVEARLDSLEHDVQTGCTQPCPQLVALEADVNSCSRTKDEKYEALSREMGEMRGMLKGALERGGPVALRWPRGGVVPAPDLAVDAWPDIPWGSWEIVAGPTESGAASVAVLAFGATLPYAIEAAADLPDVMVVNARFLKPLDAGLLEALVEGGVPLLSVEDHILAGGFGAAVAEHLSAQSLHATLKRLGIDDQHVPHGDPKLQHDELGYGATAIRAALHELATLRSPQPRPSSAPPEGSAVVLDGGDGLNAAGVR